MTIAVGFFDESTDDPDPGISYTVAGFISDNETSACLELKWSDLLRRFNVEYFKASELEALEGQFRQYRDDPLNREWKRFSDNEKRKLKEIKTAFTDVIVAFSDHIYGIGAIVILPDYERIRDEYPHAQKVLTAPHYLASQMVLVEAGIQCAKQNRNLPPHYRLSLRPVFDFHETHSGRMKQAWDHFCIKNPISAEALLPPHYEDDQKYLALQVADNIAFEIRKSVLSGTERRRRRSLERIMPSFLRVYKLDYSALKEIAVGNTQVKPMDYKLEDLLRDGEL